MEVAAAIKPKAAEPSMAIAISVSVTRPALNGRIRAADSEMSTIAIDIDGRMKTAFMDE